VEQPEDSEEFTLTCRKCGRKLFRCNIAPGVCTDSTFLAGGDDGFKDDNMSRKMARSKARAAGVNPEGKKYMPGLARFHGDPRAWVSGKSDVKRICEKEGWACTGAVNVKGVERDEPNPLDEAYSVDPKLVDREIETKELLAGERYSKKERESLKDSLVTQYSGNTD
jgi:hypothetical protein